MRNLIRSSSSSSSLLLRASLGACAVLLGFTAHSFLAVHNVDKDYVGVAVPLAPYFGWSSAPGGGGGPGDNDRSTTGLGGGAHDGGDSTKHSAGGSSPMTNLPPPPPPPPLPRCTNETLDRISHQLDPRACYWSRTMSYLHLCSFTLATKCPEASWLDSYYTDLATRKSASSSSTTSSPPTFLGISVGCNKGFDAINTARMGSLSDVQFDKTNWRQAMGPSLGESVCNQNATEQFRIATEDPTAGGGERGGGGRRQVEMHCIEPMPLTVERLKSSAASLGLDQRGFVVSGAAIGKANGTSWFPKAHIGDKAHEAVGVGTENKGMESCFQHGIKKADRERLCTQIETLSLDGYVSRYVKDSGPVGILSIDVEGYDFDVLLGGRDTLKRTHYLEFEYNHMGSWKDQNLKDAVSLLDSDGFTCYWAGVKKLWRITGCWLEHYKYHHWSNVACVHRSQRELAAIMENVFQETLRHASLVYKPPPRKAMVDAVKKALKQHP